MPTNSNAGTVVSADDTTIGVTATGDGPAVIIIDGALSYREFNATVQAVAEALADQYTVHTYDRRGRGESTNLGEHPDRDDAVGAEVADLAAVIEHAGGTASLVGLSSGAVLALEAAVAGLPVSSLALYEAPFVVTNDRAPVAADYRARILSAIAEGRPGDAVAQFLTEAVGMPDEFVEPMRAEPYWNGMEALAPSLAYDAALMADKMAGDPRSIHPYRTVTTPTLVMHGGNTDTWLAASAESLTSLLANAQHDTLADQDHDVSADALVPVLTRWLATANN